MVNYYEHLAAEHDHHAVLSLVQIYAHGSKEVYVDMPKVRKYLRIAAIGNTILMMACFLLCFL
jgi:hypothetical protein